MRWCPLAAFLFLSCTPATAGPPKTKPAAAKALAPIEKGGASYYHPSLEGNRTANGEKYVDKKPTCAHRKHPFGTMLKVTDLKTGRSVTCRVNDRGPFVKGRVIDLTGSLAQELGIFKRGVATVNLEVLAWPKPPARTRDGG